MKFSVLFAVGTNCVRSRAFRERPYEDDFLSVGKTCFMEGTRRASLSLLTKHNVFLQRPRPRGLFQPVDAFFWDQGRWQNRNTAELFVNRSLVYHCAIIRKQGWLNPK